MNNLKRNLVIHSKIDRKYDHEENRIKVYAPYGRKIIFGNKKLNNFLISKRYENLIKIHISENFNISDTKFPKSICCTCRLTLKK